MSDLSDRLLRRDATLWPEGSEAPTRLGWLDVPRRMEAEAKDLRSWAGAVDHGHIVLLGMGGSSLGPAVLEAVRLATGGGGASRGGSERRLTVLDTTDPTSIEAVDTTDAFFLVSSKSGTTLEPRALMAHFWDLVPDGRRWAAITDPGTPLQAEASARGFARVFANQPDIGGRYSVLSYFGLVPGALVGYDPEELCALALETDVEDAVELGRAMGEAALAGQDKVTVVVPEAFSSFGLWVEQLIAESTGKQGRGCVPVPTTEVERGDDRHLVQVAMDDAADLGPQFYRWEMAVAIAGHVLDIDPFDQPNVAESKENTNRVLDDLPLPEVESVSAADLGPWLQRTTEPGDYVSLQAYLPFGQDQALEAARRRVRDGLSGMAVTAGYGPRFLHSTGQLHKGGPDSVVAVQLVQRSGAGHLAIPGFPYDFATLLGAQAIGDHQSLESHGRRVQRVAIDDLSEVGAG
ncbi:MAG: glucose-6-phosphate isomerase [Acidimicrobiales bacterium]